MKLSDLYPTLTTEEREALATKADMSPGYLWQLATGWRGKKPSGDLIVKLSSAEPRMTVPELMDEFFTPTTDKAGA